MKATIAVAVMVVLGAMAGCNKDSGGSGGAGGSGSAASGGGGGGDSIGVKECDDYIAAWNNCYKDPAMKAAAKPAFDQVRQQWAQQAKDPNQKAGLQMACKAAADSLKQSGACK